MEESMQASVKRPTRVIISLLFALWFLSNSLSSAAAMPEDSGVQRSGNSHTLRTGGQGGRAPRGRYQQTPPPPTPGPETTPGPTALPPTTSVTEIFHILDFPFETLVEALVKSLTDIFSGMYESVVGSGEGSLAMAGEALSKIIFGDLAKLEDIRKSSWQGMAKITAVLLPVFFLLTVSAAMREGVTSITGYANAREALIQFFISTGTAAASYMLVNLGMGLSVAAARGIGDLLHTSLTGNILAGLIIKPAVLTGLTGSMGALFLAIFVFVFVVSVILSASLAFLASEVILLLLVALAPLVIMMGAVQPLRWLHGLWTKALVILLILKPVNVLLLSIGSRLQQVAAEFSAGLATSVLSLLIMIGVASVLVSLNAMVGKAVYGAAMEVAKKAWRATQSVLSLAALGAGLAAGPGVAGALAGTLGGGGSGGGAALGGGSASAAGGLGAGGAATGPGGQGTAAGAFSAWSDPGPSARQPGMRPNAGAAQDLSRRLGAVLSGSRNPIVKGLGIGMQVGGAGSFPGGRPAAAGPDPQPMLDYYPGLADAEEEIASHISRGNWVPDPQVPALVGAGTQLGKASMDAAQAMGIPIPRYLSDLGYAGSVDQAGAGYLRAVGGRMAMRAESPWKAPPPSRAASPESMSVYGAVEILQVRNEAGLATQDNIVSLATMIRQRHAQLGESIPAIVKSAADINENKSLDAWLQQSYAALPYRPDGWQPAISEG